MPNAWPPGVALVPPAVIPTPWLASAASAVELFAGLQFAAALTTRLERATVHRHPFLTPTAIDDSTKEYIGRFSIRKLADTKCRAAVLFGDGGGGSKRVRSADDDDGAADEMSKRARNGD